MAQVMEDFGRGADENEDPDKGGDSSTNRAKMDQGSNGKNDAELDSRTIERGATGLEHDMASTSLERIGHTSRVASIARPPSKYRRHAGPHESKGTVVYDYDDKDDEPTVINGNGTEAGHTISTTVGGRNGQPKQTISYMAERVVGTGSFGVVFQARCLETGETVAIKKVLQDKRYKNRELQIMRVLNHPNVLHLEHCFYSASDKDEVYLNLVLEYVSETVYRASKRYVRMNQHVPTFYVQLYVYQIFRGLNYLHNVVGVCHRDTKPRNLLVNPRIHQLKICDFGSAKKLVGPPPKNSHAFPVSCYQNCLAHRLISVACSYQSTPWTELILPCSQEIG
ncbi:hypothetical protein MLD38_000041 [Melastoma candidum]|uniref:Uncharacterized protein n=1 Tax=Melastoma candidum TaxID=119954 RepID=A0ACB9S9M7_9MYRT|nr:hypothetical protein MLD38_000041 [Melastoma candidum]